MISSCAIDVAMVWIILFLPLCVWLGISIISQLNLPSIGGLSITLVIFTLIELRQVSRDKNRDRTPLWIMCLTLLSIIIGVLWK